MRQNLKKILAALLLAVCVLGLTACGNTAAVSQAEAGAYDEQTLQAAANVLINSWAGMQEDEIAYYAGLDTKDAESVIAYFSLPFTPEAFVTAFEGYRSSVEELGAYVSTDGYETPQVDGDEITLVTNITYENRKADLTLVFDEDGLVQSVTLDPEYTIAEILQKALMNTILGMGTVFVMLIFISLVIYCFNFIPNIQAALGKKAESEKKDEPEEEVTEPRIPRRPFKKIKPASGPSGFMADKELVAAITAAICAYEGTSSGGFVVRSIRRADASKWKKYN